MTDFLNISPRTDAVQEMHGHGIDHPHDTWVRNLEATAALLIALGSLLTFAAGVGAIPDGPRTACTPCTSPSSTSPPGTSPPATPPCAPAAPGR